MSCSCGCKAAESAKALQAVYALGHIEPRFPSVSIEKELVQATGRADAAGLTDRQVLHSVLADTKNRYLVRQLRWVFSIEGIPTYIVLPTDSQDLDLLVQAVRPNPRPSDVDILVGIMGSLAPPEFCSGLIVPLVRMDQLYSFEVDDLMRSIPRPPDSSEDQFKAASEEVFYKIMQIADNAGATDEHRALNYLAVRYPGIYAATAESHRRNQSLSSVEVRPSRLSGVRKIVDAIFSFNHRETDVVEKSFIRIDVTEQFPFLVTKMQPYFDR